MDTLTLLVADCNEEFRMALAETLQTRFRVRCCGTGKEALEILRDGCDVMVMDLSLPDLAGEELMHTFSEEGIHPVVLAATRMMDPCARISANQLGAEGIVQKPCDIGAVVDQIVDLVMDSGQTPGRAESRAFVRGVLLELGICTKHVGYSYLVESILRMVEEPNQSMTKELYPAVARIFGCEGRHVERSIRSALDAAWRNRDKKVWNCYFSPSAKRPTNAVFISYLAELLQMNREEETGTLPAKRYRYGMI